MEVGVCEQSTSMEGSVSGEDSDLTVEIDAQQLKIALAVVTRCRNNMVDVEVLVDIQTLDAVAAPHRLEPEPVCSSS